MIRPSEAARQATAQYAAMGAAAGEVRNALGGGPALTAGDASTAAFLRGLSERHVAAVQPERALREAEKRYGEVVRIDPSRASAWEAIGGLALDLRDYKRAEEAHRALLRLEPAKVSAWLRLAAALARQERWRDAREAIAKAQALDAKARVDPELVAFLERQAAAAAPGR